ncbi:MAG: hypothetical protein JJE51_12680 [Thermoanaerobaculia bacterium]|nr:hypothetical protein [Thermoanaerobaculia bacterium]
MKHHASPDFWRLFDLLPTEIQKLARGNFELLKANPRHPSLHFKKAGGYWSVRVSRNYRALGKQLDDGILWGWIGSHAEYERILAAS